MHYLYIYFGIGLVFSLFIDCLHLVIKMWYFKNLPKRTNLHCLTTLLIWPVMLIVGAIIGLFWRLVGDK